MCLAGEADLVYYDDDDDDDDEHENEAKDEEDVEMKILVPVKRVIDYNVKPRVMADGTGVDLANVKMSMNPFDEIAIEEAVRLKEKGAATEVVVVTIGVAKAESDVLLTARAMGADETINYHDTPEWEKAVLDLTNGEGVDQVVEVGGAGHRP